MTQDTKNTPVIRIKLTKPQTQSLRQITFKRNIQGGPKK